MIFCLRSSLTSALCLSVLMIPIALAPPTPAQSEADALAGVWCGSWQSCRTGHRGKLSATFCRIDGQHVQARFRGTFAKIVPFRYQPVLTVVHEEPGLLVLQGTQRLPMMGDFHYQATVAGDTFSATYQSRRDRGTWTMSR
jgi:hypothetical protein